MTYTLNNTDGNGTHDYEWQYNVLDCDTQLNMGCSCQQHLELEDGDPCERANESLCCLYTKFVREGVDVESYTCAVNVGKLDSDYSKFSQDLDNLATTVGVGEMTQFCA
eukprot:CAMPEP_0170543184 /NCGR_PEP_ID=MMETSP0211-20121228/2393_1 /TAXON_ID=311385 /ORGANISM="Pseudokeronopsis sp., Strain OXSARD2" /LENGTH=108 /DNA_ID=CAMNT_0010846507 /DNA_START=103 /DNA_END=429 /DNA_ORIENTATION=+